MLLVTRLVRVVWRRLRCTFFYFASGPFFSLQFFNLRCTMLPRLILFDVSVKRKISCKYNPSRRLNICYMKSNNIRLRFIASSFQTSMSCLSQLRAIIYFQNNTSLLSILMHGLPISNGFIFLDEGHVHLSYSTSANHYVSLTYVKYKQNFLYLQQIE